MGLNILSRIWSSLVKTKVIEVGSASSPAETPELYFKLALQCLERADRTSPRKFNEEQCKYLVDKLRLAVLSAGSVLEQIQTEFVSLALPEEKARLLEIFQVLHPMGMEVESFTQSCCEASWVPSALMLSNMSEHVASIGLNLELCWMIFSGKKVGGGRSLSLSDIASVRDTEAGVVKEMANLDEMSLVLDLGVIMQSSVSSSADYQLASFLLGRLEMVRLYSGASVPISNNGSHLHMKWSLEQTRDCLGKGASGSVHKATWLGVDVAKKTFHGSRNADFLQEVSILEGLSHPHIVPLLWYAVDARSCHLVMELMDGDLYSLMQERMEETGNPSPPFCIPEALDLLLQIGEGMLFLHEKRIVHRDLKSLNILFKRGRGMDAHSKSLQVKVADFGLSKTKECSAYSNVTLNVGTTRWMAPEVMKAGSEVDLGGGGGLKYPFKIDVYSFGMVCFEILTGDVPFSALSVSEAKSMVLGGERPQLPEECPDRLMTLIKACWSSEASTRPSFIAICQELRDLKYTNLMTYWIENNSGALRATTARLVANLSNPRVDMQQMAAYGICLRASKSAVHRACIANEGAIPLLVALLLSPDPRTQETAFSALWELSVDDCNKRQIVSAGAIDPIVEVLRSGSMAAQDAASELLFILSLLGENKIIIGRSVALGPLVDLVDDQFSRQRYEASAAFLSLCSIQENRARAVEAGVDYVLFSVDAEGFCVWGNYLLASIPRDRSLWYDEDACSVPLVLLSLCSYSPGFIKQVRELNVIDSLSLFALSPKNFSARAKWSLCALLELLKQPEVDVLSHKVEGLQT